MTEASCTRRISSALGLGTVMELAQCPRLDGPEVRSSLPGAPPGIRASSVPLVEHNKPVAHSRRRPPSCSCFFTSGSAWVLLVCWIAATNNFHRHRATVSSFTPPSWVAMSSPSSSSLRTATSSGHKASSATSSCPLDVPFVVERVDGIPRTSAIYNEIADMCIDAFFNDHGSKQGEVPSSLPFLLQKSMSVTQLPSLTKSLQLAYLRNLQSGDLKRRRERESESNMMFVARRLVPIEYGADDGGGINGAKEQERQPPFTSSSLAYLSSPLVLDLSNAYNLRHSLDESNAVPDFVRGEILGFVEVTNRQFGLGMAATTNANGYAALSSSDGYWNRKRPVLTNLSVRRDARGLGVGSKLLELCEQHIVTEWGESEVVLEVEDDNDLAKDFYRKRGYHVLFTDGTARRYDLSGLWLREVRCQRLIMRKQFATESPAEATLQSTVNFGIKVLQAIKDNMFSSVA